MARVDVAPRLAQADTQVRLALGAAIVLLGAAAWLVLARHPRWGGGAALSASVLLIVGSVRATDSPDRVLRFLDSLADRAFDGALFPAIAIEMRHTDRVVSALALGATGMAFLAAYMRARGWALGFVVRDSLLVRAGRYVAVGLGLLTGGLLGGLVAALVLTGFTAFDDARQVGRQPA